MTELTEAAEMHKRAQLSREKALRCIEALTAENAALREAINYALSILEDAPDLNPSNHTLEDACIVNDAANRAWTILSDALTGGDNAEG